MCRARGAEPRSYYDAMNRVVLTIVLVAPIAMVGAVMWGISQLRPQMSAPPVGAGAGSTGGANAIGEYLAHGSAKRRGSEAALDTPVELVTPESLPQGFVLVVTDQSKLA